MFGFITPNFQTLSDEEKSRYQSVYCGLCHSLRDNYSNVSRLALSYDLTFLVLLLSSLYEPDEKKDNCNCIFHPGDKYETAQNEFSDYCADLTVALAYHKILDDINDDDKLIAKVGERALASQYKKVKEKLPDICALIEKSMAEIQKIEYLPGVNRVLTAGRLNYCLAASTYGAMTLMMTSLMSIVVAASRSSANFTMTVPFAPPSTMLLNLILTSSVSVP